MAAIMKSLCFSFIVLASFATLFAVADARRFYVGGNGVWAIAPQESYKTWAERNRFQVNDTLYFKYAKGSDSVQRVMKADFDGCNIRNPLQNFDDGESEITLNRSGPFYFISGNQDHCMKGQKLIVVVLAVRNSPVVPISPAKPPSMAQPPKSPSPVSPIAPAKPPSTTQPPKSPSPVSPISPSTPSPRSQPPKSPSPVSNSPAVSPSHAPAKSPTTPSPSPSTSAPANTPKSSSSHAPAKSPTTPSPSPSTSAPANSPTSSPSPTTPLSPSPSDSTPSSDNVTAPAPSSKNAASGVAVTSVTATLLSVAFTVLMFA